MKAKSIKLICLVVSMGISLVMDSMAQRDEGNLVYPEGNDKLSFFSTNKELIEGVLLGDGSLTNIVIIGARGGMHVTMARTGSWIVTNGSVCLEIADGYCKYDGWSTNAPPSNAGQGTIKFEKASKPILMDGGSVAIMWRCECLNNVSDVFGVIGRPDVVNGKLQLKDAIVRHVNTFGATNGSRAHMFRYDSLLITYGQLSEIEGRSRDNMTHSIYEKTRAENE